MDGLSAALVLYINKISNNNVLVHNAYSSNLDVYAAATCRECKYRIVLNAKGNRVEINDTLIDFCEKHRHLSDWDMGNFIIGGGPTLSSDIIKQVAKLSDFNVDLQARHYFDHYEYRAVCNKCNSSIILSYHQFQQEVNRLGYDGEDNAIRDFCKSHSHQFVEIIQPFGRKFKCSGLD